MSELMPLNNLNAMDVFQKDGLQPILDRVAEEARSLVPDVSTEKGRKQIASIAFKVAKSKTYLDGLGKDLVSDWKKQAKVVDNERKRSREFLDDLKDEVRKPLDEWEQADKDRIDGHLKAVKAVMDMCEFDRFNWKDRDVVLMENDLCQVEATIPSEYEEFEERMLEVREDAIKNIKISIELRKKQDADQAELEQLRQINAEREAKEAEERAEKARKEREEQIRKDAAEKEKRASQEREEALQREKQEAHDAKIRAQEQAAAAEKRAKEAEAIATQRAKDEQARIKQQEADEIARRERNKQHKGKIHREIMEGIEKAVNLSPATSKKIVTAMAKGEIPHITVNY